MRVVAPCAVSARFRRSISQAPNDVQPFKFLQIDVDAARLLVAAGGVLDDLLKLGGTLGGPGAARRERYAFAPTLASPACGGG